MNVYEQPNAPPVVSAVALTVIRFGWNHVVSPSPGAENDAGTSQRFHRVTPSVDCTLV